MRARVAMNNIRAMGYDPQQMLLEVEFAGERVVHQYEEVPEQIWYGLRNARRPDWYFNQYVSGHFPEKTIDG